MAEPLAEKIALITGGSRGIGAAVARKLAAAGCDVAINYYSRHAEADAVCVAIRKLGRRACAIQANVASPDSVAELLATFSAEYPRLDILVSNAASGVLRPTLDLTLKHWRWCLETNALALNLLAQHAVSLMSPGGRIIALSSLGAQRALPDYAFVGASKAALEALVRSLAVELAPRGIGVNAISAGLVNTDALRAFPQRDAVMATVAARTPSGAVLEPTDVANAVYLLCLPEAQMITGQILTVDGGYSIVG